MSQRIPCRPLSRIWTAVAGMVILVLLSGSLVLSGQDIRRLDASVEEASHSEAPPALDGGALRQLAERILEDDRYQRSLPAEEVEEEEVPGWLQRLFELRLPTFGLGRILLFFMATAVAVLLVVGIVSMLRRDRWSQTVPGEATATSRPSGPLPLRPVTLEEAQVAAARGDFGEAVHLLLLHALGQLSSQQPLAVSKARTSREVLRRVHLQPLAHEALETLVGRTESWLFGGRELREQDYRGCLEACRVLAGPRSTGNKTA